MYEFIQPLHNRWVNKVSFKRSTVGLNSKFFFSLTGCIIMVKEPSLPYDLSIFGLVFLFNGISAFVGYLMPKPFSSKNSSGTI